jgi:hypothetical protein
VKRLIEVAILAAFAAAPVLAQAPDADVDPNAKAPGNWTFGTATCAGLGATTLGPIDAETPSGGNNGILGVAYLNGTYHVSSRGVGAVAPHLVYRFDSAGAFLGSYQQVAGSSTSAWGYRDLDTDGTFIYGGWETGLARHNADGTGGTVLTAAGAPGGVGTWRALAYDPSGAGGAGSFWTASFGTALAEVRADNRALIRTFPNIDGWSLYGLAKDPCGDFLWGYSSPDQGRIVQISTVTGRQTNGKFFPECVLGPGIYPPHPGCQIQGGLSGVPGGAGGSGNFWDMVSLGQATPDSFTGHKVYADNGCDFCTGGGCGFDPCDTNCDTVVDAFDIEPFISVLLGGPGCSICAGDANGDMVVDAFDIEPFIACLVGP